MSQPTKDDQFQFNKPVEDILGASAPTGVPGHLKEPGFLSKATQEALASMEKGNPPPTLEEAYNPESDGSVVDTSPPDSNTPEGFDFRRESEDILNNDELRQVIEARCPPMSLDELISTGKCRQKVPVLPGTFEPTFQTVSGEEDLFVKSLLYRERGSDLYVHQKFTTLNLTMGLYAINSNVLPPYEKEGKPDQDLFMARYEWVQKLPTPMLLSLQVNYYWFDERARKMFSFREVR